MSKQAVEPKKEMLLTDAIQFKGIDFKAVYIPNDAYYIYHRTTPKNYEPIYRELARIEDNDATYQPSKVIDYYLYRHEDVTPNLTDLEMKKLNYIFLEAVEPNIVVKLKLSFEEVEELIMEMFTGLAEALSVITDYADVEAGILPIDIKAKFSYERYKALSQEDVQIAVKIEDYLNLHKTFEVESLKESITTKLTNRKKTDVELGRRDLSQYLSMQYGVILRKYIGTLYKRDGNGYAQISHDDLILQLKKDFEANFIHDNDLKNAIGFISDRLEPVPNIVKFKNTLYDMEQMKPIEQPKDPIFTLLEIPYNYNPNAESTLMKEFLETSLERQTEEETSQAVEGIKQFTGYLFTSGNKHEILPIVTGLTGAGKSVFFNIITAIFGKDRISGISLQRLEKDSHASSQFINAHLNIIRDSDTSMITNNSLIKNWTGNESFSINPKYKQPFDLPAEEVPKPILVCNTMPEFKVYEDAVIRRFVIIEFLVSFTKTGKANPNLEKEILSDDEEIEWFIYQSLQAFKEMEEAERDFIFKIGEEETKELIEKHTHPLNHIVEMLIEKHDPEAYDTEKDINPNEFIPVYTDDLVEAILFVSDRDGIDVPVDKHGRINKTTLVNVIRDEFDLHDGEIVRDRSSGNYSTLRDYKARNVRWQGRNAKAYPNLIPKKQYREILDSIQAEKILEKHR